MDSFCSFLYFAFSLLLSLWQQETDDYTLNLFIHRAVRWLCSTSFVSAYYYWRWSSAKLLLLHILYRISLYSSQVFHCFFLRPHFSQFYKRTRAWHKKGRWVFSTIISKTIKMKLLQVVYGGGGGDGALFSLSRFIRFSLFLLDSRKI